MKRNLLGKIIFVISRIFYWAGFLMLLLVPLVVSGFGAYPRWVGIVISILLLFFESFIASYSETKFKDP